jgi:hypothetical protein
MTERVNAASLFRDMAARIDLNPTEFQGAYLCVGPDGVIIQNAFFGPSSNIAVFWGTAKNHIGLEADEAARNADQKNAANAVYGRR